MKSRPIGLVRGLAAAAIVTACSSDSSGPQYTCPSVSILAEAATVTHFGPGSGRDLVDVDHEARMFDVTSGCTYEGRPGDASANMVVAVAPSIDVTRGPANTDRIAQFTYFVSVVDPDGSVRNKQEFPVTVQFEGNRSRLTFRDDDPPIIITLSAAPGTRPSAASIYLGFQLTAEDLRFNRETGRPR